jgi:hypothetical protein
LGGEDNIDLSARGNTESVRESFRSTESPTASALLLISDGVDTSGPLFRRVEVSGDIVDEAFIVEFSDVFNGGVVNEVSSQVSLSDFFHSHTFELGRNSSFPAADLV